MSFSETLCMLYMYIYILYIFYIYIYVINIGLYVITYTHMTYHIYILLHYTYMTYYIYIITLYIYDIYSMYIQYGQHLSNPECFMGKPIYVVTVTKQKYYMQGEGEGGQIQIHGLTSPSFLSYFKYLEEKILFWKQPSRIV